MMDYTMDYTMNLTESVSAKIEITGEILGTGDLFHPEIPNSSFLMKVMSRDEKDKITNEATFLIDCGYNIYPELVKQNLVDDIDVVFITHTHADHYGSLEALNYHRMFKSTRSKNLSIRMAFEENQRKNIQFNSQYNYVIINGKKVNPEFLDKPAIDCYNLNKWQNIENIRIKSPKDLIREDVLWFNNTHFHKYSVGYVFNDTINNRFIIISGDTKADYTIKHFMDSVVNNTDYSILLFHDLSEDVTDPLFTTHCTYTEFKHMYGHPNYDNELYNGRVQVIFYHNNDTTIIGKTF